MDKLDEDRETWDDWENRWESNEAKQAENEKIFHIGEEIIKKVKPKGDEKIDWMCNTMRLKCIEYFT